MKILVIEDDHLQAEWICKNLEQAFRGDKIDRITMEMEFRSHFDEIANDPPDVVIMDVMLRWADPSPDLKPPPDDVKKGGFYRAGLRCTRILAQDKRTEDIPVILYTVLEHNDLQQNNFEADLQDLLKKAVHLPKEANLAPLIQAIRKVTRSQQS